MVISLPLILRFVNREGIDGMYLRRDQLIIGNENISSRSSCICIIHQMVICIALACVKSASSCRPPYSRALGVNIRSDYLSTLIFIRARVGEIIKPYTVLHNSIAQPFLFPPHHLTVPSQSIRSLPPFLLSSHPTLALDGPPDHRHDGHLAILGAHSTRNLAYAKTLRCLGDCSFNFQSDNDFTNSKEWTYSHSYFHGLVRCNGSHPRTSIFTSIYIPAAFS